MPHISQQTGQQGEQTLDQEISSDRTSFHRALLGSRLDEVASSVRMALDDAALHIEVFLVIPSSGAAIITYGTPADPCDEAWDRVDQIISGVVGDIVGLSGLHGRELPCITTGSSHEGMAIEPVNRAGAAE